MGGGGSSTPMPSLNATQIGTDQTKSNVSSAISQSILNNTNQITPTGSLTYTPTGGQLDYNGNWVPQYTAEQKLSPELQGLYGQTTGLAGNVLGQVGQAVNTPLNFSGAPAMPGDQTAFRNQAYDALMGRTNIDLARARGAQDTQLANQGINQGSEAWNRAQEGQNRATTDASQQAFLQAGNLAGQNLQQAQTSRNQYINELQAQRNQPLADYQALLGLGQGTASQQFANTPQTQIQPADITSPQIAAYQAQLNAYNNAQQQARSQSNGLLGGLFGLGGSVLGGIAGGPFGARIGGGIGGLFGR